MFERKRIHIICSDDLRHPFNDELAFHDWCSSFFELHLVADTTPHLLLTPDPFIAGERWLKIARLIKREWSNLDGAVVVLPVQELALGSFYIQLLLGDAGKPVVCIAGASEHTDTEDTAHIALRARVVNAVQVATAPTRGVVTIVDSDVIPAHAQQLTAQALAQHPGAQHSIGRIDFGVRLNAHAPQPTTKRPQGPFVYPAHVLVSGAPFSYLGAPAQTVGAETSCVISVGEGEERTHYYKEISGMVHAPILLLRDFVGPRAEGVLLYKGKEHVLPHLSPLHAILLLLWVMALDEQQALPQEWKGRSITECMHSAYQVLSDPTL